MQPFNSLEGGGDAGLMTIASGYGMGINIFFGNFDKDEVHFLPDDH